MIRARPQFSRLIEELSNDIVILRELEAKNGRALRRLENAIPEELDWDALGYTIHNIYGAIENYCLRVAKFFENELESTSWHRDLIRRMSLSVPELRPALFDRELADRVDDLRAFRHRFRNMYGRSIDPERVKLIQAGVPRTVSAFYLAHEAFLAKLHVIREGLHE